ALADLLAVDVLFVVQRRARDRDAADLDRREDRPWVERTGAADADHDLLEPRHRGHRRPLERARPARTLVQRAEPALLVEVVDLDDDAVDLVVELRAPPLPRSARVGDRFDRLEPLGKRVDREAVLLEPLQRLPVRRELDPFARADAVRPDRERP